MRFIRFAILEVLPEFQEAAAAGPDCNFSIKIAIEGSSGSLKMEKAR